MSAALAQKQKWTVEEYLAMERDALTKHEFFDGEIIERPGASYEHNLITSNVTGALLRAVGDQAQVLPSDMRLYIPATGLFTYADVIVLEGPPDLTPDNPPALKNPSAIIEVLSDSTEKFGHYRSIPALQHYLLVSQNRIQVEYFARQPTGWLLQEVRAGQCLKLPWGELPIDSLYHRVPRQFLDPQLHLPT